MPEKTHAYAAQVVWTGNLGSGTSDYRAYSRDHELHFEGKGPVLGSADPLFRGDKTRCNPEELFVASLSACHMLWFLHLCADAGVTVTAYEDDASGTMVEESDGGGEFSEVVLRPRVTIAGSAPVEPLDAMHRRAHSLCFLARSVNFPVRCEPRSA
jgi:organic hydroperoxide reductase OsmC/OhrA